MAEAGGIETEKFRVLAHVLEARKSAARAMTQCYEFHPVCELFPVLEGAEFDALVEDIREHGGAEPVWLHAGKIIDGRNRYLACKKLGIEVPTRQWLGNGSLMSFVVSENLKRRHLSQSQPGCIGAEILPRLEEEAKARQLTGKSQDGIAGG
jgi:hypothetical protein